MLDRTFGRRLVLAAALGLVGCGHPEQRVVDQYFNAINAGDDQTVVSFAAYKFDKKVDKWRIVSAGPESKVDAPLPGLVQQLADAQQQYDAKKKDMQRFANERYNDYVEAQQLLNKGAKVPPKLADMAAKLEEWGKTEKELKVKMAQAKAAADAERRLVQLSWGPDVKDIDTVPAEMQTTDVQVALTVKGQEESWTMHLRKYTPKQASATRVISRWIVQSMERR
jgi:hypothetical protein